MIEAARLLMAERGLETQMDDIARAAGVGVGTVYRHFPTKADLIEALAVSRFERLAEWAREALATEDPAEAFETFMQRSGELQATDRAISQVMRDHGQVMREAAESVGLLELTAKIIARAQKAGHLRPEVRAEDVPMIMCGLGISLGTPAGQMAGPDGWRRFLEYVLRGMRV